MLELQDVSLFVSSNGESTPLLSQISACFPTNHFAAVIGPSGCGKSTLLKTIAGIAKGDEEGDIFWNRRSLNEEDFEPSEIGYVPQFSIAHDELTVYESVETALRLRVGRLRASARRAMAMEFLEEVGMAEFHDRRVAVLSGGQQRRLSLAMEIASRPHVLLCDEVTSGLDPQAEDGIVKLLHNLSKSGGRLILSVTHSLEHLDLYDSVLVLAGGRLAYHGPSNYLAHYFQVSDPTELYAQLEKRTPEEWGESWNKHSAPFVESILKNSRADSEAATPGGTDAGGLRHGSYTEIPDLEIVSKRGKETGDAPAPGTEEANLEEADSAQFAGKAPPAVRPGAVTQFFVLLFRRLLIFSRNPAQLGMQAGLIFGFPVLVAIFAWNGLPNVMNLSMAPDQEVVRQLQEAREFLIQATKVGSLVSGIVMFQVILLTLMGANNSGREIASERLIFEKEKLSGLRPSSYVASKVAFLSGLVLVQSLWMGLFVHFVCDFPGDLLTQLVFLVLVNGAMTSVCLALSSWLGNAEQASLASIYLVGFQLPLSGAVLALPELIGLATRPFIAAYWSWSGILQTLKGSGGERYYDIVSMVVQTSLSPALLCLVVLVFHILVGVLIAFLGCQRSRLG